MPSPTAGNSAWKPLLNAVCRSVGALVFGAALLPAEPASAEPATAAPSAAQAQVKHKPSEPKKESAPQAEKPPKPAPLQPRAPHRDPGYQPNQAGIAGNPGAVNVLTGTGRLGRLLGFADDSGVRLGGLWIGNGDYLMSGGKNPGSVTFNSLFIADLKLDLNTLQGIPGAIVGATFLQFDGQDSNGDAGVLTGYNGLTELPPLNRSELYQLWWRQSLLEEKLILRVGKTVPTFDFNNVIRALPIQGEVPFIPAVSGLLFTPIFVNPSVLGVLPGYYNSAWGITATAAPNPSIYASYGIYDGSLARGRQTGTHAWPVFDSYYFNIGELGYSWTGEFPGKIAVGGWGQTGTLGQGASVESGAQGFYALGSRRLWSFRQGNDGSAVLGFLQYGINNSTTMLVNQFVGGGLTGFGLIPGRPKDSVGLGVAVSWLNNPPRSQDTEILTQIYYQAHLIGDLFFQPAFSFVPNPGIPNAANGPYPSATALILQLTALF